jgi:hypothetical protein
MNYYKVLEREQEWGGWGHRLGEIVVGNSRSSSVLPIQNFSGDKYTPPQFRQDTESFFNTQQLYPLAVYSGIQVFRFARRMKW